MNKKAQGQWSHIVAAILVVVVILVLIIIFTTKTGDSQKDIGRCKGLIGTEGMTGECMGSEQACASSGGRVVSTFGSDCEKGQVCCIR